MEELTKIDKCDIQSAFNLLIDRENDTVCYKPLLDKLSVSLTEDYA